MTAVQANHREERLMEDVKGALESKNYSVRPSATRTDVCLQAYNVHVLADVLYVYKTSFMYIYTITASWVVHNLGSCGSLI